VVGEIAELAVEIVKRTRAKVGPDFIIIYRFSMLDLVEDGQTWDEVVALATEIEQADATIINTGIGWHETRVPTIVTSVPRAAFTWVTAKLKPHLTIPVITSNRITMPETAEEILTRGDADMISMAPPFQADPDWVNKDAGNRSDEINACIGCNQACLDHSFQKKTASCLANPRAAHETTLRLLPTRAVKRVAVVGAGPAGLAAATTLAQRGHTVDLFEADSEIGGQLNLTRRVPGKDEFAETIRYFVRQIELTGVEFHLDTQASAGDLINGGFDEVVLATGVTGARRRFPVSKGRMSCPTSMSSFTAHWWGSGSRWWVGWNRLRYQPIPHHHALGDARLGRWKREWGVADPESARGGLTKPQPEPSPRTVYVLQRKSSRVGAGLGKTTGWVHRAALKSKNVEMIAGVNYDKIDDAGLHISFGEKREKPRPGR
jgi:2,4-dienoyl-CoA reductase (NADPH2)